MASRYAEVPLLCYENPVANKRIWVDVAAREDSLGTSSRDLRSEGKLLMEIVEKQNSILTPRSYQLVAMKLVTPSKEHLEKHYEDLSNKPFYKGLVTCMSPASQIILSFVHWNTPRTKFDRHAKRSHLRNGLARPLRRQDRPRSPRRHQPSGVCSGHHSW